MQPPSGYVADPNNPGWWRDPSQDAARESAWWQEPPTGWADDPKNPGWAYDPAGDPNRPESWWHEGRVQAVAEGHWYDPVFARAQELYGKSPYAFGGDRMPGKSAGPWDCVGYVMECLDAATPPLGDFKTGLHQGYINAERARQACAMVPRGQEQPGDCIFFQGTYNTPGASHIGIVLDPARRLMADDHDRGNNTGPGETDYSSAYWVQHFMSFGRVPR